MATEVKRTKRQQVAHEKRIDKVALALRKFLEERGLWAGCKMYFNDKKVWRKSTDVDDPGDGTEEEVSPLDSTEYGNPDTVTIVFDASPLYEELNYGTMNHETGKLNWRTVDELHTMLEKLGWYYELGHAWNLSLFEGGN